jgi:hypothetical protein
VAAAASRLSGVLIVRAMIRPIVSATTSAMTNAPIVIKSISPSTAAKPARGTDTRRCETVTPCLSVSATSWLA